LVRFVGKVSPDQSTEPQPITVPAGLAACTGEQMLATIPATREPNFESLMIPRNLEGITDMPVSPGHPRESGVLLLLPPNPTTTLLPSASRLGSQRWR
jgi:hypothetical protein